MTSSNQEYNDLLSSQKAELLNDVSRIFAPKFLSENDAIAKITDLANSSKDALLKAIAAEDEEEKAQLNEAAKVKLKELLAEYENYLKVNSLPLWEKNSEEAKNARRICRSNDDNFALCHETLKNSSGEEFTNIVICLIHQLISSTAKFDNSGQNDFGGGSRRQSNSRDRSSRGRGFGSDRREGGFGERREGGFGGGRREGGFGERRNNFGGERREGGFGERREGGFGGGRREGGVGERREGGFGDRRRNNNFGERREGGFGERREGGFGERRNSFGGGRREGGFGERRNNFGGEKREGGFSGGRREGGFGERREGGFGERREGNSFSDRGEKSFRPRSSADGERRNFGGERRGGFSGKPSGDRRGGSSSSSRFKKF